MVARHLSHLISLFSLSLNKSCCTHPTLATINGESTLDSSLSACKIIQQKWRRESAREEVVAGGRDGASQKNQRLNKFSTMERDFFDDTPCSSIAVDFVIRTGTADVIWGSCVGPFDANKVGLIGIARASFVKPFLWVIRDGKNGAKQEESNALSWVKDVEKQGMIVPWCSQLEVLSHPSVGCFLTHCGWNSCIESLASEVPVVAFPQWANQPMNSKLVQDYWKTGLRVAAATDGGIVIADEIARYLEFVMGGGERGEDMRKQAQKWKNLAKEAVKECSSSNVNLKVFVDQIVGAT